MKIQLKDEELLLNLTNEENDNDNYITCTIRSADESGNTPHVYLDLNILELYSAVLSFITLKRKNEESQEYYAKTESLHNNK